MVSFPLCDLRGLSASLHYTKADSNCQPAIEKSGFLNNFGRPFLKILPTFPPLRLAVDLPNCYTGFGIAFSGKLQKLRNLTERKLHHAERQILPN